MHTQSAYVSFQDFNEWTSNPRNSRTLIGIVGHRKLNDEQFKGIDENGKVLFEDCEATYDYVLLMAPALEHMTCPDVEPEFKLRAGHPDGDYELTIKEDGFYTGKAKFEFVGWQEVLKRCWAEIKVFVRSLGEDDDCDAFLHAMMAQVSIPNQNPKKNNEPQVSKPSRVRRKKPKGMSSKQFRTQLKTEMRLTLEDIYDEIIDIQPTTSRGKGCQ